MLAGSAAKTLPGPLSVPCLMDLHAVQPPHGVESVFSRFAPRALPCLLVQVQDDDVYMVLNAGCAEKDLEHMEHQDEVFKVSTGWRKSQP